MEKQDDDLAQMPQWKSYLYTLQQQAPKPKRVTCQKEIANKPPYYGREYHGAISREVTDFQLTISGEGSYLIRESQRAPGQYTLAIRFEGVTKNYKLYYDGQHYVGEKRFDTINDLVADGLIIFYLESKAADYIASLPSQSNYAESPYVVYNTQKKYAQRTSVTGTPSARETAITNAAKGGAGFPRRPPRMGTGQLTSSSIIATGALSPATDVAGTNGSRSSSSSGSGQGTTGSGGGGSQSSSASQSDHGVVRQSSIPPVAEERSRLSQITEISGLRSDEQSRLAGDSSRGYVPQQVAIGGARVNDGQQGRGGSRSGGIQNKGSNQTSAGNQVSQQSLTNGVTEKVGDIQLARSTTANKVDSVDGPWKKRSSDAGIVSHSPTRTSSGAAVKKPTTNESQSFTPPTSPSLGGERSRGSDVVVGRQASHDAIRQQSQELSRQHSAKASSVLWCTDFLEVMGSEKTHNFKLYTFKGPHWCDFCANFLWGLIAQGVKCQDCGFNAHKKCSEKVPNDCMPDMKYVKRMFGIDLTTLVKAQNTLIPVVVELCIKEIERRGGVKSEGLYRVAGYHDDVEAIKMAFDKEGEFANISDDRYDDLNTIASVLKLYFRLLPIPLITFDIYVKVVDTVRREDLKADAKLELLQFQLAQLPPAHFHTLKYLMAHLHRVTEHQTKSLMSAENLAIIFAPTLLRSPETDPSINLAAVGYERKLIEQLITHHVLLFDIGSSPA